MRSLRVAIGASGISLRTRWGRKRLFLVLLALTVLVTVLMGPTTGGPVLSQQGSLSGANTLSQGNQGAFQLMAHSKKLKKKGKPSPPVAPPATSPPVGGGGGTGSIDLSLWDLQLPSGAPGNPTTIPSSQLVAGFSDQFFLHNSDGSITFVDPGTGCVTTANSKHCRSELREVKPAVFSAGGTNTLSATLTVNNAAGAPVIGQIHDDQAVSVRPLVELFYSAAGDIVAGTEQCLGGGCEIRTTLGHVAPGTQFSYQISYSQSKLSISINGGPAQSLSSPILGVGGYFKAGDYGQSPANATVTFYSLKTSHS